MRKTNNIGIDSNATIYNAIKSIALHGVISPRTGTTYTGNSVSGYVTKIHDDPSDPLFGTVDVKEWNTVTGGPDDLEMEGYHTGVYLSAIQDSNKCTAIVPKLYSSVMITQDPSSCIEYVTMYSHADVIRVDSQKTLSIGVIEREEYDNSDENSPDIDELEPTGVRTTTTYTKDTILTEAIDEENSKQVLHMVDVDSVSFDIADGETTFSATQDEVEIQRDDSSASLKQGEIYIKVGNELIKVTGSEVYVGGESGTSHAVLGEELADILADICNMIAQIKTTTQLGPQPPLNMAQFISTQAKIKAWRGALSGFISKKVNIQH